MAAVDLMYSNTACLLLFVAVVVVMKYGVAGYVLSKTMKSRRGKEGADAAVTAAMLVGLWLLNRDRMGAVANDHTLLNVGYTVAAIIMYYGVNVAVGETLGSGKSDNQKRIETLTREVPLGLSLLATGVLAPVFEEVVFRYYLQDLALGNGMTGLLVSSLLFALMHMVAGFSLSALLSYMGASVVVGVLYMVSGGLLFSCLMHVVVNSLAVMLMYRTAQPER